MNPEELFQLDVLELALQVLRSPLIPEELFPAARRVVHDYEVMGDPNAIYRLTASEYSSLRRTVIQSFRMTFIRSRALNIFQLICIDMQYCRHRNIPVVDWSVKIAQQMADAMNLPDEIAGALSVLLIKIQCLDLFCACEV